MKLKTLFVKYPYLTSISIVFLIVIGIYVYYPFQQRNEIFSVYSHLDQNPKPGNRLLPPKDKQEYIRILAIEGGGVYGLLPAHVLKYIEEKSGKPVCELFDVIMGTSTGAILSVLLTIPDQNNKPKYTAAEGIEIYRKDGQNIFYNPWYHRILTLNGVLGPRYMTTKRYEVFKVYAGNTYFDQLLSNVIIPAYEDTSNAPLLFVNWKQQGLLDLNFMISDLLMGAVSTPGYFPGVVFGFGKDQFVLSDGGVFANNPSLAAALVAMKAYPNKKYILVSLGTGTVKGQDISYKKVVGWGALQWGEEIIGTLINSGMKFNNVLLEKAFPFPVDIYYFDTDITGLKKIFNDISPAYLLRLNKEGDTLVKKNQKQLNELVTRLLNP